MFETSESITAILFYCTVSLVGMFGAMILFIVLYQKKVLAYQIALREKEAQKQRELLQATIQSQELEQTRIAKDLHDGVLQQLASIRMGVKYLEKRINNQEDLTFKAKDISIAIDEAISETRMLTHSIVSPLLVSLGLPDALRQLVKYASYNLNTTYQFIQTGNYLKQDYETELGFYRIAQEALQNISKYARANNVYLNFDSQPIYWQLTIKDDGVGFDTNSINFQNGIGIKNMQSRATLIGATIDLKTQPHEGCTIILVKHLHHE